MPSGAYSSASTVSAPMAKKRTFGDPNGSGRNCEPLQMPHTTSAPTIGP